MSLLPPPSIYNLFPRLAGRLDEWEPHLERAARLGFDWVYLNPVFYPGFSGSAYAVKDYGRLDPAICPKGDPAAKLGAIAPVLARAKALGLRPMVDLVINHTARDCELTTTHPEWYCRDKDGKVLSPFAIDPADARKKTVWGDLAELDHAKTTDPGGLMIFLEELLRSLLAVGFEGFRCDAAYKVPAATWIALIETARSLRPDALFLAETLGCREDEFQGLAGAGFDLVMNSSKYWAFDAAWCLDQHEANQKVAPSVSFPESHDTPRLAHETKGSERLQRQRFVLAAIFSRGLLVPVGYELGFRTPIDVVKTRAPDWEAPLFDLGRHISGMLALKRRTPVLAAEGHFKALSPLEKEKKPLVLEKRDGAERALIVVNRDDESPVTITLSELLAAPSKDPVAASPKDPVATPLKDPVAAILKDPVAAILKDSVAAILREPWTRLVRPCLDSFEPERFSLDTPLSLEPSELVIILP